MKRILLVEDDDGVRDLLAHALEDAGYEVKTAVTFLRAKDLIVTDEIDLLVSDVVIPGGGSGLDLANLAVGHGVGCVLVTGHPEWVERVTPALPCLVKPFKPSSLVQQVRRLSER